MLSFWFLPWPDKRWRDTRRFSRYAFARGQDATAVMKGNSCRNHGTHSCYGWRHSYKHLSFCNSITITPHTLGLLLVCNIFLSFFGEHTFASNQSAVTHASTPSRVTNNGLSSTFLRTSSGLFARSQQIVAAPQQILDRYSTFRGLCTSQSCGSTV
jgi:hypothetical protein